MTIDTRLLLFDFEEAYEQDAELALKRLERLLRDEATCEARVEMQTRWRREARRRFPDLERDREDDPFAPELEVLASVDAATAVRGGRVSPQRMGQLLRHAEALWEAHLTVAEREEQDVATQPLDESETHLSPAGEAEMRDIPLEHGTITQLAAARNWDALETQLRPFLTPLMMHVGLDVNLAETLLKFIVSRADDLRGCRFCERLPDWLREFAAAHDIAEPVAEMGTEDWLRIVESATVTDLLNRTEADEPEWARAWRQTALRQRPRTARELLSVELPAELSGAAVALPDFRRNVYLDACEQVEQAVRLFELN